MDLEKPPAPRPQEPEGCLVVAVRLPVRIVVLVLVVPVRMVWDALVVAGRLLTDAVLRPVGRASLWVGRALFVWPFVGLWRYGVVPLARALAWLGNVLVVVPAVWLYRYLLTPSGHALAWGVRGLGDGLAWVYARVLTPVGHAVMWTLRGLGAGFAALGRGVRAAAAWLARYLVAAPAVWVYTWILTPVGHAISWCVKGLVWCLSMIVTGVGLGLYWVARILVVLPALAVWRWVLVPVGHVLAVLGRETADALGHAWRIAGHLSLAVGRFLGTAFRWIFVEPVRWAYRTVLTPVGHVIRDTVLRPAAEAARGVGRVTRQVLAAARESARQARADFRRMLLGKPGQPQMVDRREPTSAETRTLGRSTTALTKD
ncbi:hypothetical protein [Streptomyces sp. ALI-76-A]|uniref:hypothetical protein n=1 Tax=Streptomyces sp. ALI-76-A TaxID=3025736 RepID=UPI00256E9B66|nr:hypothetical protein [Streptomyces sp. ALI-76-A]MDL5201570.1 hypothetical protein [Streptomyces sp. ALI-76-A]